MYRISRKGSWSANSARLIFLLFLLVSGSVFGAFSARRFLLLHSSHFSLSGVYSQLRTVDAFRFLILFSFFSVLLFAAGLSQQDLVLNSLLFFKGFFSGYCFWLAGCLSKQINSIVPAAVLLLFSVLPLPAYLLTASLFLQAGVQRVGSSMISLFLLHCVVIAIALMLRSVFL